ncbi:MAG: MFS transporter [Erythrobacter sp.]|nr:MFS transporter [Erythrobacter sp.]
MAFVTGPLPQRLKIIHGFGAVAFGVKDSGFSFFLLLYYSQVLGMDAGTVSLALLLALLFDAVIDPILGNLSDRTYSRWGRRLPWLYSAPIPLAIAWVLLWSPPTSGVPSFGELLTIAIVVRVLLSACEVPSVSLVPEMTADYDDRTTLFRYRFLSGWIGGLVMMVLAYLVFMPGPDGLLQPEGYASFGIFGAVLIVISVIGSAAGQHHIIARLPREKPPPFSVRVAFQEIIQAFSERSFLIFAAGGLAAYVSQGMTFSITNYLNLFVWKLKQTELVFYPITLFFSVILMFVLVGPMHRRYGKPKSAVIGALASVVLLAIPYVLLLAGLWPEPGTLPSTVGFFAFLLIANTLGVVMMISATSMIAEIVEAFEERTHRRAEGAFYSGNWLVQKCATGFGIFVTGQIISLSQLAPGIQPGEVEPEVIRSMVIYYIAFSFVLAGIAAYWLGNFPISREEHEERVATLEKRRKQALDAAARGDIDAGTIVP